MNKKLKKYQLLFVFLITLIFIQCNTEDDNTLYVPPTAEELSNPNDLYLYSSGNSLYELYGTATRWRWNDNFIDANQSATPINADFVIPTTRLIEYLWIGPYTSVGEPGEAFISELFPAELQYIGSYIYKDNGDKLLGFAEGGARISLLNLNSYDLEDRDWLTNPGGGVLSTVHHESSHIVHQNYGIPIGFNTISESYLGAGWSNGVTRDDAIKLGMVRNYGTVNEFEDFCEIVSHFLTVPEADFEADFIDQEDCTAYSDPDDIVKCQELNEGRVMIQQKLELVIAFYSNTFDIDLVEVRDEVEIRINYVINNNEILD